MPWLVRLEERRLLAGGSSGVDGPIVGAPLAFGAAVVGNLGSNSTLFYEVAPPAGGRLTVVLNELSFAARLSLVDAAGQPLVQSDGSATSNALIDENVPAGQDLLEVQSLGTGGSYSISAAFTATTQPFVNLPSQFVYAAPLVVADLDNDNISDLITPDGVQLGVGNGTFLSAPIDGPLAQPGFSVTGIAAGDFNGDKLPDFAVLETSDDGTTADVRVFLNMGADQFTASEPVSVDPNASSIQELNLGSGPADLALLDNLAGTMTILVGNGAGTFTPGPILPVGGGPVAMVAGAFASGQTELIIADQGSYLTGTGPELTVLADDGQGQFPLEATIPLLSAPSALAVGDFGNGHLDLAIADIDAYEVTILFGNGDGTFQAQSPVSYAVGSAPDAILAYSLRDNGVLDLVTTNANSDDVSVLLGNGDGTFQSQVRYGVGSVPAAVVAADLNGDLRPDLLVANQGDGPGDISVLLGRGDGTFQGQIATSSGVSVADAVTADLNDDGHLDIVTVSKDSNEISVLLGNGDGTFRSAGTFAAGADPLSLVVGDFNGDGRLDIAVADGGIGGEGAGVSILLGNGDGSFQCPVPYAAGGHASSIVAGDFTGNGVLDLAVTNPGSNDVTVLFGNGRGGFPTATTIPLGPFAMEPVSLTDGDFTGHGVLDLAVANQASNNVSIVVNDGRGDFVALPPISLGDDSSNLPYAIVAGVFTGNGLCDLAVISVGSAVVSILLATGQGNFALAQPVPLGISDYANSVSITTGRFYAGGPLDLAVADSNSGDVLLLEGDGTGGFQVLSTSNFGSEGTPTVVTTGDFTNSGRLDLAVILQGPTSVAVELGKGDGHFVAPDSVGLVPRNTPVVADFTGDGVPDIAIVNGAGGILFRQGVPNEPGTFEPPVPIDSDHPSRDIAAVITLEGLVLASVDADDNNVSLFVFRNGAFHLAGTLATGLEPAQIVSANLNGHGDDDLIIRNVGDGTLTIYLGDPFAGGFGPPITLTVGSGVSDVSVADLNQDGLGDILLANQTSGEVDVIMNQGGGHFSAPVLYRAGVGLSAVAGGSEGAPLSVNSMDGTVGVVAVPGPAGSPGDIVALDAGADTLGVLIGLGGGQFANPYSLDTKGSTLAVSAVVLAGGGIYDLAILGPDGVTIWLGNGQGGFVPGATYNAGPDPTGLTIAYAEGNALPDLVIGNAFGDVLILVNQGNGLFAPPAITKDSVSLAVTVSQNGGSPTFVYSNQAGNSVNVQSGSLKEALGGPANGWLAPGALSLADLNRDGIPDLIVVDTGGNEVFVYPGLPNGKFGPALNNGNGFAVGTTPVAVTVANLNGHPDLLVANQGSNDVSVLLNKPLANGSFTFVSGPRISAGFGPDGLLYGDLFGNGSNELVVSDRSTNELMVIPSLGGGFFDDMNPMIIPLSTSPGPIFGGSFGPGPGLDIVVLDPGTSEVTLISALSSGSPTIQQFPSGGLDPVAAIIVHGFNGFDDLVVANNADGAVSLLTGGPEGLTLAQVNNSLGLLNPTGLALGSLSTFDLDVYAATAGAEAAILLGFSLGGLGGPSANFGGQALTLLSSGDSTLPLIATLLTPLINLNTPEGEMGGASEGTALAVAQATTATTAGLGQGPFTRNLSVGPVEEEGEFEFDAIEAVPAEGAKAALPLWRRIEMGLDEAFDALRRANQQKASPAGGPDKDEENQSPMAPPGAENRGGDESDDVAMIDAAIHALASRVSLGLRSTATHQRGPGYATFKTRVRPFPWQLAALALVQSRIVVTSARRPAQARFTQPISSRRLIGAWAKAKVGTRHRD